MNTEDKYFMIAFFIVIFIIGVYVYINHHYYCNRPRPVTTDTK